MQLEALLRTKIAAARTGVIEIERLDDVTHSPSGEHPLFRSEFGVEPELFDPGKLAQSSFAASQALGPHPAQVSVIEVALVRNGLDSSRSAPRYVASRFLRHVQ
ncbi:MAG: hypothetical protein JNL14_14585 [Devosia sp.]|uniref:hypothetical protein n=1 Tax=Devosia sp. TaxID=1871048 RepID=UPI001A5536EB|nr:hypothetical protein [Devosia sp.]MBL8598959.1 hypothetical protein [Devosia sp.]